VKILSEVLLCRTENLKKIINKIRNYLKKNSKVLFPRIKRKVLSKRIIAVRQFKTSININLMTKATVTIREIKG